MIQKYKKFWAVYAVWVFINCSICLMTSSLTHKKYFFPIPPEVQLNQDKSSVFAGTGTGDYYVYDQLGLYEYMWRSYDISELFVYSLLPLIILGLYVTFNSSSEQPEEQK